MIFWSAKRTQSFQGCRRSASGANGPRSGPREPKFPVPPKAGQLRVTYGWPLRGPKGPKSGSKPAPKGAKIEEGQRSQLYKCYNQNVQNLEKFIEGD